MVSKPKRKRIYLINRDFQMRYIRAAVIVALCSTVLTMFLILFPLFYLKVLRFPNFLPPPFLIACLGAAFLNFSMIAYLGVMLSHRIAGPVFAMVRHLRILQSGSYTDRMRVRDTDELKYLARHINELSEVLTDRTRKDLIQLNEIIDVFGKISPDSADKDRVHLNQLCDRLKAEFEDRIANNETALSGEDVK